MIRKNDHLKGESMGKIKKILLAIFFLIVVGMFPLQVYATTEQDTVETISDTAPVLEKVEVTRDSGLLLEWSEGSKAIGREDVKYMILRSTDGGKSFQGLVNREKKYGLYFIDATGLEPGKEYFYKVREFVGGVQQKDSNVVSAIAQETPAAENEFTDKNAAAEYLKEQMVQRKENIKIIYNASTFPNGLTNELYEMARVDTESPDARAAVEGDYLRYTIVPNTFKAQSGIDGKVGNETSYVFTFSLKYYTSQAEEDAVNQVVASILNQFKSQGITRNSSEYDRVKAVYDYISETVHYNNGRRPDNGNIRITAYDTLVLKEAQCYGEVLGAYRLLKELGIPTRRINGQAYVDLDSSGNKWVNHGWNIVKIGNQWYNFDVTAAGSYFESYGQKNLHTYKYLLFSEGDAAERYKRSEEYNVNSEFYKQHVMAGKSYEWEPDMPSDLELIKSGATVTAKYPAVAGAEGYVLVRAENEKGPFVEVAQSTSTECRDKTTVAGKEYHYKVQAYKTVQGYKFYSGYSPRRIVRIADTSPLPAPQKVTVTQNTYNSLKIGWSAVEGADYYQVYRSDTSNGEYVLLGVYDSKTFNSLSKNLGCGTTYYYKVRAFHWANGEKIFGSFSKPVSGKPALPAPQNVKVKPNTYNTLKISWNTVEGADFYQVYRSTSPTGKKYSLLGVYDSKTFNSLSRSLGCGTTYYYKVRAYRWVSGERVFSEYSSIVNGKPILSAPQNVKVKPNTYNTLKISWNAVEGADFYQVYRSTSPTGKKYSLLGVYDSKTFNSLSRSLGCGTTYYYKVRAYRWVSGERVFSEYSSVVNGKPVLSAPQNIKATGNSATTVKISWDKSEGANYYQVYRSTSKNGKYALLGTYDNKTVSSISRALKKGTTYYYKVRCYRWVGGERIFSPFSSVTSAIPE